MHGINSTVFRSLSTFVVLSMVLAFLPAPADARQSSAITFAYWGDPAEADAYEQVISTFEAQHDGVRIEGQYTPGKGDYKRRIGTTFASGTPPDVFLINYREYGQYADSGALEPLGPMLDASDSIAEDDFYDIALDAFRYDGEELVCIPQNISSLVVYYNVDLFEQAGVPLPTEGWTLDDFAAAAEKLTVDSNDDGHTDTFGLVTESSLIRFAPFIWSAGGEIVDDETNPTQLTLDTPEARSAISWFTSLGAADKGVVPTEAEVLAEDDLSRFMNGRAAMYLQSRRVVPTLREIDSFTWDVAPLPVDKEPAGILHSDAFCMSASTAHKEEAWAFIEYALGAEGQTILAQTGRTVPSMKSVAESPVFLDADAKPASSHVFLDTIPYLRRTPSLAVWPEIEDIFGSEFQKALYEGFDMDKAIVNTESRSRSVFERASTSSAPIAVVDEPRWDGKLLRIILRVTET